MRALTTLTSIVLLLPQLALSNPDPSPNPNPDPSAPYPIFQSTYPPALESLINNDVQSFLATQTGAAWSSARAALATATDPTVEDIARQYRGEPNYLALEYATAAATPTWFSALPVDLQHYVASVAAAEARVASSDVTKSVDLSATAGVNSYLTMSGGGMLPTQAAAATTTSKNEAPARTAAVGVMAAVGLGVAML